MRKEIECVNPTTIDQVLQRYMELLASPPDCIGAYRFDDHPILVRIDKQGDLKVDLGHLYYGTVPLDLLNTLEKVEIRLHRAGLLSKDNVVVVKAKTFQW